MHTTLASKKCHLIKILGRDVDIEYGNIESRKRGQQKPTVIRDNWDIKKLGHIITNFFSFMERPIFFFNLMLLFLCPVFDVTESILPATHKILHTKYWTQN